MLLFPPITLNPPGYGRFVYQHAISFSLSSPHFNTTSKRRPPPPPAITSPTAPEIITSSKPQLAPFKLATAAVAATMIFSLVTAPLSTAVAEAGGDNSETLSNIPQTLSSGEECSPSPGDCKKSRRIQRPKSKKAETCTVKCLNTCIRGGYGSPGEGPVNIRRPLVVFKDTFRSRTYCLMECSDICNLIGDLDDGP